MLRVTIGVGSHFLKYKKIPHSRIIECELSKSRSLRSDRIIDAALDFVEKRHPSLGVTHEWLMDGISLKPSAPQGQGPANLFSLMSYGLSDIILPDFLSASFSALHSEIGPPPPDRAFAISPMINDDRRIWLEQHCRYLGHLGTWATNPHDWIDDLCDNLVKVAPRYIGNPMIIHLPKDIVTAIRRGDYMQIKSGYRKAVPVVFQDSHLPTHAVIEMHHGRNGAVVGKSLILIPHQKRGKP